MDHYKQFFVLSFVLCFSDLTQSSHLKFSDGFLHNEMVKIIDFNPVPQMSNNLEGRQFFPHYNCSRLLHEFSEAAANYTLCGARFARPVNLCLQCKNAYLEVINKFNEMEKYSQDNITCKEVLTKQDKLDIITAVYNFVTDQSGVWALGNCNNCYNRSNPRDNIAKEAYGYVSMLQETWNCFNNFVNTSDLKDGKPQDYRALCGNCSEIYLQTRKYFWENLVPSNKIGDYGAVCIDLKDAFNFTGYIWGIEFQCNNELEMGSFWILILIPFTIMIIITYGVPTFVLPWYHGANHKVLTLLAIPDHYDAATTTYNSDVASLQDFLANSREDGQEMLSVEADLKVEMEEELYRLIGCLENARASENKDLQRKLEQDLFDLLSEMRKHNPVQNTLKDNFEQIPFVEQIRNRRIERRGQSFNQPNVKLSDFQPYLSEEDSSCLDSSNQMERSRLSIQEPIHI